MCLVAHGQLTVTSLPAVLFDGGSQSIVEGSVIWLYCQVNSTSPTLTVTWTKDSVPVVLDVPHIRMRRSTSASSTILILIVDNFQSSDTGMYQCTAQEEGGSAVMGTSLMLTGIKHFNISNMMGAFTIDQKTMLSHFADIFGT